jgi:hypothetical protein
MYYKTADIYLLHDSALNSTPCSDNPISSYGECMGRIQESQSLIGVIVWMQISCDIFRSTSIIVDYYFYLLAVNNNHCEASSQISLKNKQAQNMQFVTFV